MYLGQHPKYNFHVMGTLGLFLNGPNLPFWVHLPFVHSGNLQIFLVNLPFLSFVLMVHLSPSSPQAPSTPIVLLWSFLGTKVVPGQGSETH